MKNNNGIYINWPSTILFLIFFAAITYFGIFVYEDIPVEYISIILFISFIIHACVSIFSYKRKMRKQ